DLGDDVVHVALAALEYPLQILGIVFEPRELLIDRRLLHLIERKSGAHSIEQIVVVLAVVMLPFARHGQQWWRTRPGQRRRRARIRSGRRRGHDDALPCRGGYRLMGAGPQQHGGGDEKRSERGWRHER